MPVQNMLLYPGQDYGHYPQQHPSSAAAASSPVNSLQQNAALLLSSLAAGAAAGVGTGASAATSAVPGSNGAILALGDTQPAHTAESTYPVFSLRPLIDSIFEVSSHHRTPWPPFLHSSIDNCSFEYSADSDFDAARCQQFGGSTDRQLSSCPGPGSVAEVRGSRHRPAHGQSGQPTICPPSGSPP